MKTISGILSLLTLVLLFFACGTNNSESRLSKNNIEKVTGLPGGQFKATYSPDGKRLITTSLSNDGIKMFDFETKEHKNITKVNGAGQDIGFTPDGKFTYYVTKSMTQKKWMQSLIIHDLETGNRQVASINRRDLKVLQSNFGPDKNIIPFFENGEVLFYDFKGRRMLPQARGIVGAYSNDNLNLTVFQDTSSVTINPNGNGQYIWVSLSPDYKRVLYSVAGKATYSCNLNGGELVDYGTLHAPKWSPDGKHVIGMDDYDDGEKFTKSDIYRIKTNGTGKVNLTKDTDIIALYPDFSNDKKNIVFNDENGHIYTMNVE